jgi:uncharacterized protein YbjT (DUF2867 family)
MASKVLVTGATGGVGRNLVRILAEKGVSVRAGFHTESKSHRVAYPQVELVKLNFADITSIDFSLHEITTLFLLTPIAREQVEYARRMIDRAVLHGVKHIVYVSILRSEVEPGTQITRWHRRIERYLQQIETAFTIIKPNMYMQNFLRFMQPSGGIIFLPLNGAMVSYVDVRDIARLSAQIILEGQMHFGKQYEVTGPSGLSIDNVAEIISSITCQNVGYVPLQEETALHVMECLGIPSWMASGILELYTLQRMGLNDHVSKTIDDLTGTPPLSFEQFTYDHMELFKSIINKEYKIYLS